MYLPNSPAELFDILNDLQSYAALEAMTELSEILADAKILLVSELTQSESASDTRLPGYLEEPPAG